MENKCYCSVCGKEKEKKFLEFANVWVYILCECEKQAIEKNEKEERKKALDIYFKKRTIASKVLKKRGKRRIFKTGC